MPRCLTGALLVVLGSWGIVPVAEDEPPAEIVGAADVTTSIETTTGNRYARTAAALVEAPPEWRSDFASKSLLLLAEIYLAESDLARREAEDRDGADAGKLRGWSRAVSSYGDQLLLVLDDVELGFPVDVLMFADNVVGLRIADRTVMLNHPRVDQQSAYEQRVLSGFCSVRDCDVLTPPEQLEPIPMTPPTVAVDWRFSDDGPVCESAGIAIQFNKSANLARVRPLCTQLLQELLALELELRWQKRHGVAVDYAGLQISATPRRPEHLVSLNAAGDSMLLSLPLLYGSEGLLAVVTEWLETRVEAGGSSTELALQADQFGWN